MDISLRPHPSKDEYGNPLFPQLRSIWVDGLQVGYTGDPPWHRVSFIIHGFGANEEVVSKVRELVKAEFGLEPDRVINVPEFIEPESEEEYED